MMINVPHLQQFLSSYFHQDWMLEGKTDNEIISTFVKDADIDTIKYIIKDIDHFILYSLKHGEDANNYLYKIGSFYYEEDMDEIQWLRHLRSILLR